MKSTNHLTQKVTKVGNKLAMAGTAVATVLSTKMPVFASFEAYNGTSSNSIMSGAVKLFSTIGTYGGGLYAIVAVFTLVLAIRNEDNEGRNKAILNLLAAIALLSMGAILTLFGLKSE